jgi:hypothetical protein
LILENYYFTYNTQKERWHVNMVEVYEPIGDTCTDSGGLPFGITPGDIEAFGLRHDTNREHNAPVRDITKQDFWDFMLEPIPESGTIYTPEILETLGGGGLN